MRARYVFLSILALYALSVAVCGAATEAKPLSVRIHSLEGQVPADLEWVGYALAEQATEMLRSAEGVSVSHHTADEAWLDEQVVKHPELAALVRAWGRKGLPKGTSAELSVPRKPPEPADVDVSGHYEVTGDWLRATLEVRRGGEDKPEIVFVAGSLKHVAALGDELGRKLARVLSVDLSRSRRAKSIPVRPANLEAAREYFIARQLTEAAMARSVREVLKPGGEQRPYPDVAAESYEEIARHLDRATEADPRFAAAYAWKADAALKAWWMFSPGRLLPKAREAFDAARSSLRNAIRLSPGAAEPHQTMAMLLHFTYAWAPDAGSACDERLAAWAAAFTHLRRAAELAPDDPSVHAMLGTFYMTSVPPGAEEITQTYPEVWDAAVAEYKRAIELGGDEYALTLALFYGGRPWQAEATIAWAERAVKADPDDALAWSVLARGYIAMDRAEEAEIAARRAVEIESDSAEAHVVLGKALAALGNTEEAATAFQRALALDPDNGEAKAGLEKMAAGVEE